MKCRNIIRNGDGTYNIVWFGSYGATVDESLQPEYASFPIVGRTELMPDEYPYMVCGFDDINNNATSCHFNIPRPNMQNFILQIDANDGEEIAIRFYNTNNPSQDFYIKTFTGSIDINDKIPTNSNSDTYLSFEVKNSGIYTIRKFFLKLAGTTHKLNAESYVEKQENVAKSLIQRLAVIKSELWYDINYGLPLLDKPKNKAIIDAAIIQIINNHEEVVTILNYVSSVEQKTHTYFFKADIQTIYNETISISSEYLI